MSGLDDVRAQIVADLEQSQGPWRKKSAPLRFALLLVPASVVVGVGFLMLAPERGFALPVVVAGLASLLALCATALAPAKPAASERLSQAATAVAVAAFVAEVARMDDAAAAVTAAADVGVDCLVITAVLTVAAAGLIAAGIYASRLPLRLWHKIGLATAATLGACSALWHHCPSSDMLHIAVGHTLGPVALIAVVVVALGRLQR